MYKTQLVEHIAAQAGLSNEQAKNALHAFMDTVQATLQRGGKVTLIGFGSFNVMHRKGHNGTNPATSKPMWKPATKIPGFKAGKTLKSALK
jgi:DNA-binding protein HU-beta